MILTKQEGSPNKVILATPDGSGVNQLLFASPELAGQQIQVPPEDISDLFQPILINKWPKGLVTDSWICLANLDILPCLLYSIIPLSCVVIQFVTEGSDQSIVKPVVEYCVVCGDKASGRI